MYMFKNIYLETIKLKERERERKRASEQTLKKSCLRFREKNY